MCYEFVHSCEDQLTDQLAMLVPADGYFLVCIGDINYLHCKGLQLKTAIKTFLFQHQVKLYSLPAEEMISVIDFPGMKSCQTFHGSRLLLQALRNKYGILQTAS